MANKVVQLVDKNSNNLYPIAGSVITDAVSTTAISNQAVTNPKIENGAVNGVANDATAIGTAKLALDTVGTPNLRDAAVTSDKIDWTTMKFQIPDYVNRESISVASLPYTVTAPSLFIVSMASQGLGYTKRITVDGIPVAAVVNLDYPFLSTFLATTGSVIATSGNGTIYDIWRVPLKWVVG